jgi:hypothetical protein
MKPPRKNNPILTREAWVLCFLLGMIMLNYPFIHIFNKETTLFGIPLLFLYFILGWPASIAVIYLFSRSLSDEHEGQGDDEKGGGKEPG